MDRIDLADHPHQRQRCWELGERSHWRHVTVQVGELEDGRWYAAKTARRRTDAWAAHTERQACQAADAWMKRAGSGWRETTGQDA
jgi:hypothetical protein